MSSKKLYFAILFLCVPVLFFLHKKYKKITVFENQEKIHNRLQKAQFLANLRLAGMPLSDSYYQELIGSGKFEVLQENYQKAIQYSVKAKAIYPNRIEHQLLLAEAKVKYCIATASSCDEAQRELSIALENHPKEPSPSLANLLALDKKLKLHLEETMLVVDD